MSTDIKTYYATSDLITNVTGHPGGEEKKKDVFILSHPDIMNMMRYIWAGCDLPTDHDDYIRRMGIDESVKGEVTKEVNLMVAAYSDVQKDNQNFRDNTWKGLVDLSGKIINYAKVAGGTVDSSYYVGFLQSIQDYHDTTEQKKKDDAREAIKEFTNDLIARITELQTLSVKARDDLETFKTATTKHSSTLQTNEEQVKKLLDDTEIKRLEGEIKTLQKELDAEHDELSYDLKVAETTPAYAWVTIFGFIAAIAVASIYGLKIRKIKENIQDTEGKIKDDQKKLEAARIVSADAQRMSNGASALINLINPAIKTVEELETVWQTIADDLKGLNDAAKDTSKEIPPGPAIEKRTLTLLVNSWNDLGGYVNQYRQEAYTSQPETLSLDQWVKEYGNDK
ncbi:hypothetical protein N7537_009114 [Penicillium hordei]|uniref:Uncharacterized protein n=1 Tax=Penicillium hordei TaxID=40994 RepID=A0AAD6DSX7_9EURO|nr:uncharacterized protein N7537_009114 [Penicillium hordei]KAJ5592210.1 hypothetical protein N7537_009114 [Penicillium hordei]